MGACTLTHAPTHAYNTLRFGKTISVSMFAAALMFSCAGCEVSIYSTCKRISTKLLRNVSMFLGIIYDVLKCDHLKIIRANQEEVHLQGDEGYRDVRIIQSYPSKVQCLFSVFKPSRVVSTL
jgi:ubiquitin C-terminal hydrolase